MPSESHAPTALGELGERGLVLPDLPLERSSGSWKERESERGNHFWLLLLKQPALWLAGDRLLSLDREQLGKSELMVRKKPASFLQTQINS